jgi:hypothetical protein
MRIVVAMTLVLSLTSCAARQSGRDTMCSELVRFANASPTSGLRTVRLMTDWSTMSKGCAQRRLAPEKRLCSYLLEHTSTEFASINYKRVLGCFGFDIVPDASEQILPSPVTDRDVMGVHLRRELTATFAPGNSGDLPFLEISVGEVQ